MLLLGFAYPASAQSQPPSQPPTFENAVEEKRFHALAAELRCVMCQNQSLADSDAQIAKDLRRQVLQLMREGRSDAEIREFLVARYGEFVLYRPRVSGATWLLWFGPLVFVLGGIIVALRLSRGTRGNRAVVAIPKDDSQEW
jgi:cytochrome c-type biogenesis protein CcmH